MPLAATRQCITLMEGSALNRVQAIVLIMARTECARTNVPLTLDRMENNVFHIVRAEYTDKIQTRRYVFLNVKRTTCPYQRMKRNAC